jgi:hypothetical protein
MKTSSMKTLIRKELREMGFINGETIDHKSQMTLCRACAGETSEKVETFHRALNEITNGNHSVSGAPLTIADRYL